MIINLRKRDPSSIVKVPRELKTKIPLKQNNDADVNKINEHAANYHENNQNANLFQNAVNTYYINLLDKFLEKSDEFDNDDNQLDKDNNELDGDNLDLL